MIATQAGRATITHVAAWFALPVLAVTNGVARDLTYGRKLNRDVAHSVSCVPLAAGIVSWAAYIQRRWPLASRRDAILVGAAWLSLTLQFEFGLGSARGVPMSEMLAEYNVLRGRLWALIPAITAAAPELARRLHEREGGERL